MVKRNPNYIKPVRAIKSPSATSDDVNRRGAQPSRSKGKASQRQRINCEVADLAERMASIASQRPGSVSPLSSQYVAGQSWPERVYAQMSFVLRPILTRGVVRGDRLRDLSTRLGKLADRVEAEASGGAPVPRGELTRSLRKLADQAREATDE